MARRLGSHAALDTSRRAAGAKRERAVLVEWKLLVERAGTQVDPARSARDALAGAGTTQISREAAVACSVFVLLLGIGSVVVVPVGSAEKVIARAGYSLNWRWAAPFGIRSQEQIKTLFLRAAGPAET